MIISEEGTIYLGKGDEYIEEYQGEDDTERIAIIELANGLEVRVIRHYSRIRPSVITYDGWELHIELDEESGTLQPKESPDPNDTLEGKRRRNAAEMLALSDALREQASSIIMGE